MSKILAMDYGTKRIGIAISDQSKVFSFALETVSNSNILSYLRDILNREKVETIVIGKPNQKNNEPSLVENEIIIFIKKLKKNFPQILIERIDERFTSVIAKKTILQSGIGKIKRRNKNLVDKVSATLILQTYLHQNK
ncbi:MAG: Holliday junction resolvase RuvX [Flavobacteriaceae bacterium]|tara:strand:+ start:67 stop:480 length:414 start_codon:yes stop_codon:yes gene_type:complete